MVGEYVYEPCGTILLYEHNNHIFDKTIHLLIICTFHYYSIKMGLFIFVIEIIERKFVPTSGTTYSIVNSLLSS